MGCLPGNNVNVAAFSSDPLQHAAVGSHRKFLTLIWEITAKRLPEKQGVEIAYRGSSELIICIQLFRETVAKHGVRKYKTIAHIESGHCKEHSGPSRPFRHFFDKPELQSVLGDVLWGLAPLLPLVLKLSSCGGLCKFQGIPSEAM